MWIIDGYTGYSMVSYGYIDHCDGYNMGYIAIYSQYLLMLFDGYEWLTSTARTATTTTITAVSKGFGEVEPLFGGSLALIVLLSVLGIVYCCLCYVVSVVFVHPLVLLLYYIVMTCDDGDCWL